ncbi:hypothetical protein [Aliiroseovarius crassostreae]|uniref:hypothetical protein n=1 Tax=Aliiroseovarius crassostreae TaxID=154981 RepID=UPI003C7C6A30
MKKELIIFLVLNVGLSLVLTALQALLPDIFWTLPVALTFAALILMGNIHRIWKAQLLRMAYAVIAVLNLATLVLAGNVSFLTSFRAFYVIYKSFVGA